MGEFIETVRRARGSSEMRSRRPHEAHRILNAVLDSYTQSINSSREQHIFIIINKSEIGDAHRLSVFRDK